MINCRDFDGQHLIPPITCLNRANHKENDVLNIYTKSLFQSLHVKLSKAGHWFWRRTVRDNLVVVNNIDDNPITIGGDALLWLLHHQVAAWVEADSAPSGALDLDMGAIKVGGVDEGAGRE